LNTDLHLLLCTSLPKHYIRILLYEIGFLFIAGCYTSAGKNYIIHTFSITGKTIDT